MRGRLFLSSGQPATVSTAVFIVVVDLNEAASLLFVMKKRAFLLDFYFAKRKQQILR